MPSKRYPGVTKALIEWLEATYPNRVPSLEMSDREVWIAVGEQRVISKLRNLHDNPPGRDDDE